MSRALRVVVADDEPDLREYLRAVMVSLGHEVVGQARDGEELLERCAATAPDLVVTDVKMPKLDGIDAAARLARGGSAIPVILVSAFHDTELLERAARDQVLAYLIKPIQAADLEAAIAIVMKRFQQFQELRREASDLRQALSDRKVIERAKGILMKRANLDEGQAFRRLQRLASDKNKKLVEIAQMILTAEEALSGEASGRE
jgi:response regulator NasT